MLRSSTRKVACINGQQAARDYDVEILPLLLRKSKFNIQMHILWHDTTHQLTTMFPPLPKIIEMIITNITIIWLQGYAFRVVTSPMVNTLVFFSRTA